MSPRALAWLAWPLALLLACQRSSPDGPGGADAGVSSASHRAPAPAPAPAKAPPANPRPAAQGYFDGLVLVDQDGAQVRLYEDLIRGKVIVINTFFASCQGACPVLAGTLTKLQARLGDRLGKDVHIASITVEPEVDTPEKLKEYALRLKAKRGWRFLTGPKASVHEALRRLGQYVEQPSEHSGLILAGNDRTGLWKKAFGLADPDEVLRVLDSVVNDRGEAPQGP
ncbi:SCO family protein [Sorangium sp. So ce321]|uniref:SCO family protein n=1 Tax=Sorangium sp. So ce321 TaxID=3133300 RepID=UPI003F5F4F57